MSFLVGCARIGFARTCKQVLTIVRAVIAKKQGLEPESMKITSGWWASYRKHHPNLTLHSASRLVYARAVAQDPEVISAYFLRRALLRCKEEVFLKYTECLSLGP